MTTAVADHQGISVHSPFSIGLSPLNLQDWFEIGGDVAFFLEEKERLEREHGDAVFRADPGASDAQEEVLRLVADHLPRRFPSLYRRIGDHMEIAAAGRRVPLAETAIPALRRAAHLVPDDLVIMHRAEDGWRLTAASLSFPSSWSLAEKFGRPLHHVHAPVPGFGEGTRNAGLIGRIFDNLHPDMPVWRQNWSIYADGELYHPARQASGEVDPRESADRLYLRRERQTLRKLPGTGAILFTIGITVDPLDAIPAMPGGADALTRIAAQISAMTPDQLAYKGMATARTRILALLAGLADR